MLADLRPLRNAAAVIQFSVPCGRLTGLSILPRAARRYACTPCHLAHGDLE
jgi:hypothetical protein